MERKTYNVPEVARILGVSTTSIWEAIWRGELRHIRIGKRVLVPRHVVDDILAAADRNGSPRPD
jgi:excisionase family DNA binding protein